MSGSRRTSAREHLRTIDQIPGSRLLHRGRCRVCALTIEAKQADGQGRIRTENRQEDGENEDAGGGPCEALAALDNGRLELRELALRLHGSATGGPATDALSIGQLPN